LNGTRVFTLFASKTFDSLQLRDIGLRILWLAFMAYAFTELFFLGHNDPVANKAYLVVLCAVIVLAGNLIYPYRLFSTLTPVMRCFIWSLILAGSAFFLLLIHNNAHAYLSSSALMALAVFNLSFFMGAAGHLFLTTNKGSHPAQLTFAAVIVLTTLPIWLGPWIDTYPLNQTVVDLIISASPLTHLAIMAEFDYLRSQWFYQHTPYGAIQFSYPTKLVSTVCYNGLSLALFWIANLINTKVSFNRNNTVS
jgi:hypothetical protein